MNALGLALFLTLSASQAAVAVSTQTTISCAPYSLSALSLPFGTQDLPGGVLRIEKDGQQCASAAGFSNLEKQTPMDDSILFPIASNTKMFTAAAILQLSQEGKLDLNKPATEYLPANVNQLLEKIPDVKHITVVDLLRHSTGLNDYLSDPQWANASCVDPRDPACLSQMTDDQTIQEVLGLTNYSTRLNALLTEKETYLRATWFDSTHIGDSVYFEPLFALAYARIHHALEDVKFRHGTAVSYSNTDYLLLGLILENLEGRAIHQIYQARIWDRLGMRDTFSLNRDHNGFQGPFTPYLTVQGVTRDMTSYFEGEIGYSDDGTMSTTSDMIRFVKAFAKGELFEESAHDHPQVFNDLAFPQPTSQNVTYSTGLMMMPVQDQNGHSTVVYYHTGEAPGALSVSAYIPECNVSFVAGINQSDNAASQYLLGSESGIFKQMVRRLCHI